MSFETMKVWTKSNFDPIVGYTPQALLLVRGWMV
jgi:hypothetical protein